MEDDPTIDREGPKDRATDGAERTRSRSGTESEDARPYRDDREHVLDELRRIDCLLRARVAAWRAETGGSADEFSGYYVSDEQVDRLLWPPTDGRDGAAADAREGHVRGRGVGGERRARADRLSDRIAARVRVTREAGTELGLARLVERFGLDADERDILLLAVAPEFDPKYETVYAYLNDDLTRKRPTVDLLLRTLVTSAADRLAVRRLLARTSPLRRNGLVRVAGTVETALPSRPVLADERVVDYLLGSDALDDLLAEFAAVVEPDAALSDRRFDAAVESQLARLRGRAGGRGRESTPTPTAGVPMAYFHGPYGSGRRTAVETLCAERDRPLVRADARGLQACCGDAADLRDVVDRLTREARLRGADLCVENVDAVDDGGTERLLRALDGFGGRVFLTDEEPPPASQRAGVDDHAFVAVEFPVPSYERRRDLWRAVDDLPADVDVSDLAGTFRLTGGQITDAVEMARSLTYGRDLTAEAVYVGCRAQSRETLGNLGNVVEPNYDWDDIVLPADEKTHLREVAAHIRHQGRVYADWGFERKFSLGNGVIALFTGPSGTGKTMAAEIIANDAGLDLYKIDLSNVVSKYIGETEKNLGEVFDEAENSDAILFFDEADALFGERSEVSDAHDRYANIEVNYLLQRIEEHDGAVILTTNFKGNIDDAFLRRIHLSIDFPLPAREARERIWRGVFPAETPLGELDYEFLSRFELTGGNIKNVALTAAFLAASGRQTDALKGARWAEADTIRRLVAEAGESDDETSLNFLDRVEVEHVVRAMRREFQKTGKLIDTESFGKYRRFIG